MENIMYKGLQNRTMPACTILSELGYQNVEQAIEWLCKVFLFKERWRKGSHRAQLSFGNGVIVVTEQQNDFTKTAPEDKDWVVPRHFQQVQLPHVDDHYEHVCSQDVVVIRSPADYPFGERQYSVQNIGGHMWTFSQSIKDVSPENWGGTTANTID